MNPQIANVRCRVAIADQIGCSVDVTYPGEPTETVIFVGTATGVGPVVMVSPNGTQVFVTDPGRFGTFGPEWVRRFFGNND